MIVYQLRSSEKFSVPYNRIGKHFDFITPNSNNTSSGALRPIFLNIPLKVFKNLSFENVHLNFSELSKYTPRYQADVCHLIE